MQSSRFPRAERGASGGYWGNTAQYKRGMFGATAQAGIRSQFQHSPESQDTSHKTRVTRHETRDTRHKTRMMPVVQLQSHRTSPFWRSRGQNRFGEVTSVARGTGVATSTSVPSVSKDSPWIQTATNNNLVVRAWLIQTLGLEDNHVQQPWKLLSRLVLRPEYRDQLQRATTGAEVARCIALASENPPYAQSLTGSKDSWCPDVAVLEYQHLCRMLLSNKETMQCIVQKLGTEDEFGMAAHNIWTQAPDNEAPQKKLASGLIKHCTLAMFFVFRDCMPEHERGGPSLRVYDKDMSFMMEMVRVQVNALAYCLALGEELPAYLRFAESLMRLCFVSKFIVKADSALKDARACTSRVHQALLGAALVTQGRYCDTVRRDAVYRVVLGDGVVNNMVCQLDASHPVAVAVKEVESALDACEQAVHKFYGRGDEEVPSLLTNMRLEFQETDNSMTSVCPDMNPGKSGFNHTQVLIANMYSLPLLGDVKRRVFSRWASDSQSGKIVYMLVLKQAFNLLLAGDPAFKSRFLQLGTEKLGSRDTDAEYMRLAAPVVSAVASLYLSVVGAESYEYDHTRSYD